MMQEPSHPSSDARVLEGVLRAHDGTTRAALADEAGLTAPSVTRALQRLNDAGLLDEQRSSTRPKVLRVKGDAVRLAGVLVDDGAPEGRCVIRAAAVDLAGEVSSAIMEREVDAHWGTVTDAIVDTIGDIDREGPAIRAAGVAIGGHVDGRVGIVYRAPNLGWNDAPVRLGRGVAERCGVSITVENDANALALYDRLYGGGRDMGWFGSVLVGRGVGLGLFLGDELLVGRSGRVGELGHTWVCDTNECGCGQEGCLEAQIGSRHLLERLAILSPQHEGDDLPAFVRRGDQDPRGRIGRELGRCGTLTGRAVASMCNLTDIGRLLVRHTGIFDSAVFARTFNEEFARRLFPSPGPVDMPPPRPLDATDLIRGAAASALFATLRDTGVAGLVTPARSRVPVGA